MRLRHIIQLEGSTALLCYAQQVALRVLIQNPSSNPTELRDALSEAGKIASENLSQDLPGAAKDFPAVWDEVFSDLTSGID